MSAADGLAPALAAEEAEAEAQLLRMDVEVLDAGGEVHGVAGRGDERGGLEVAHDGDLLFDAGREGRRDNGGADLLGALVKAEGARKEAVVEGYLDDVMLGEAGGREDAGGALGPGAKVVSGVADDDGPAGRGGGGVDADDVAERHGEHVVRVAAAEVVPGGEGKVAERLEASHFLEVDAVGVEGGAVEGDVARRRG